MKRESFTPTDKSRLCASHFKPSDYLFKDSKKLKPDVDIAITMKLKKLQWQSIFILLVHMITFALYSLSSIHRLWEFGQIR